MSPYRDQKDPRCCGFWDSKGMNARFRYVYEYLGIEYLFIFGGNILSLCNENA